LSFIASKEDHLIVVLVVIRGPGGRGFFTVRGWVGEGEGGSW
jgi:hypothetical protein